MSTFAWYDKANIPVFVGVAGHCGISTAPADQNRMKQAIRDIFRELMEGCEKTEFVLLTSLAAGADQLAAETVEEMALEREFEGRVSFAVVLPMEKDIYYRLTTHGKPNFSSEQAANAERLMASKLCRFTYTLQELSDKNKVGEDAWANKQYCEASRLISDCSVAGIALWDGLLEHKEIAGTGPAVRDFLHGKGYRCEAYPRITIPETRPIYHIYVPKGDEESKNSHYKTRKLFPEPLLETGENWFTLNDRSDEEIDRLFSPDDRNELNVDRAASVKGHIEAIEAYNKDVIENSEEGYPLNVTVDEWNGASAFGKPLSGEGMLLKAGERANLCERYFMEADALAMKYQKKRMLNIWWIVWLAGFGYIFLSLFADAGKSPVVLFLYVALLAVAFVLYKLEKKRRLHSRFVDYRALAEGMRVQYYWYASGIRGKKKDSEPAQVQNYYLRRQKGRMEWIRQAIRSVNLMAMGCYQEKRDPQPEELKRVADVWLGRMDEKVVEGNKEVWYSPTYALGANGQVGYFLKTSLDSLDGVYLRQRKLPAEDASKEEKKKYSKKAKKEALRLSEKFIKARRLKTIAKVSIILSVALVVLAFILVLALGDQYQLWLDIALLFGGLLPVIAMAVSEISEQMGYEEDVERYKWYYNAFKRAVIEIDEVYNDLDSDRRTEAKIAEMKKILFEIGEEALLENADWVVLNSKRVPEVPTN